MYCAGGWFDGGAGGGGVIESSGGGPGAGKSAVAAVAPGGIPATASTRAGPAAEAPFLPQILRMTFTAGANKASKRGQ